jgi:hypothetical protein
MPLRYHLPEYSRETAVSPCLRISSEAQPTISDTDLRRVVVASADGLLKLVITVAAKMLFDQPVLVAAVVIITGAYLT